jgi:two-component system, LuxR family, sensor kinase FixL
MTSGRAIQEVCGDLGKTARSVAPTAELLDLVLSVIPDPTVVVDSAGLIVAISPVAEKLFGYSADELTGRQIEMLLPAPVRHVHRKHRTAYSASP